MPQPANFPENKERGAAATSPKLLLVPLFPFSLSLFPCLVSGHDSSQDYSLYEGCGGGVQ